MSQQPEPPSPALEAALLATLPPAHQAVLRRILIARDVLAARVSSLEAHAQEVRRAWDDGASHDFGCRINVNTGRPCSCWIGVVGAAIDALVPPVPAAPHENEKEARS